jgi:hypothetical protein
MRRRAEALGRQIRAEDGVACAVEAFERRVAGRAPTHLSPLTSVP